MCAAGLDKLVSGCTSVSVVYIGSLAVLVRCCSTNPSWHVKQMCDVVATAMATNECKVQRVRLDDTLARGLILSLDQLFPSNLPQGIWNVVSCASLLQCAKPQTVGYRLLAACYSVCAHVCCDVILMAAGAFSTYPSHGL